jgi:hypothetical protein
MFVRLLQSIGSLPRNIRLTTLASPMPTDA